MTNIWFRYTPTLGIRFNAKSAQPLTIKGGFISFTLAYIENITMRQDIMIPSWHCTLAGCAGVCAERHGRACVWLALVRAADWNVSAEASYLSHEQRKHKTYQEVHHRTVQ